VTVLYVSMIREDGYLIRFIIMSSYDCIVSLCDCIMWLCDIVSIFYILGIHLYTVTIY